MKIDSKSKSWVSPCAASVVPLISFLVIIAHRISLNESLNRIDTVKKDAIDKCKNILFDRFSWITHFTAHVTDWLYYLDVCWAKNLIYILQASIHVFLCLSSYFCFVDRKSGVFYLDSGHFPLSYHSSQTNHLNYRMSRDNLEYCCAHNSHHC